MKIKVLLAVFLCLLSVGMVSATLSVRTIVGSAGVSYRMANDTVGINVTSSSNVTVDGIPCTKQGQTHMCIFKDNAEYALMTYYLENDDGNFASISIKVDNGIGGINYVLKNSKDGAILDYDIQDSGFENNNACSGIKTLKVYDASTLLNTVNINGAPGACVQSGSINLSVTGSGTKSLSLEVTDNAGNVKSTPASDVSIDLSSPEIITGMIIKYSGTNESVGTISNSASFLVDIYFSIREDNLSSITADISGANSNPAVQYAYKNLNIPLSNCEKNITNGKSVYNCRIFAVQLKLSGNALEMNVTAKDMYGAIGSAKLSKTFTIDNVIPKAVIKTGICDSIGRCYIHNGENKIIISINKQTFSKRYLFFDIPGSTFGVNRVQNCTASECTANISLTCSSGADVEAYISSYSGMESQDDAGNTVEPYSTYLHCDNNAPAINNITVVGESSTVIREIASGSTLKITAKVREYESDDLVAYAWLDKLKNATEKGACTKTNIGEFDCVWSVSNINAGYYDANIRINISDVAGNMNSKEYKQKVFGYKSDNLTPDNLGIQFKQVNPAEINRIVVDMATSNSIPYYVYAKYDLRVEKGNNVVVLHQTVDISKCIYISEMGTESASTIFSEAKLNNAYAGLDETGRIDFRFQDSTLPNLFSDDFTISCNISVTVREGKEIYKKPQVLQLDIPFKLVNSELCNYGEVIGDTCTPGEALGSKIERAEQNWMVRMELVGKISSFIPKLQKICDLRNTMSQATNGALIMSMVANGVAINTQNIKVGEMSFSMLLRLTDLDACFSGSGSGTSQYGTTSFDSSTMAQNFMQRNGNDQTTQNMLQQTLNNNNNQDKRKDIASACKQMVGKACDFLSCTKTNEATGVTTSMIKENYNALGIGEIIPDSKSTDVLPDLFGGKTAGGGGTTFGQETTDMLTANLNVPDVSNSIIMAAATQCWPAVFYNFNKYRQAECNYLYCLKMASYTGTDVSACDQAKATQYCSMIVGEIFELPYVNSITNLAENAADYVSNFLPLAVASGLKRVACPNDISDGDVFKMGKITLPKTVPEATYRIYLCHVPLQIARFADTQRRSSGAGDSFRYPELPDMCVYANCVGEENCDYEPNFWKDIENIVLPTKEKKIPVDKNKQTADMTVLKNDLLTYKRLTETREYCKKNGKTPEECKALYGYDQSEYDELGTDLESRGYDYTKISRDASIILADIDKNIADEQSKLDKLKSDYNLGDTPPIVTVQDRTAYEQANLDVSLARTSLLEINQEINQLKLTGPPENSIAGSFSYNTQLQFLETSKVIQQTKIQSLEQNRAVLGDKLDLSDKYVEASAIEKRIDELEASKKNLDKGLLEKLNKDIKAYNDCMKSRKTATSSTVNCDDLITQNKLAPAVDKNQIDALGGNLSLSVADWDKKNIAEQLVVYNTALKGMDDINSINNLVGVARTDPNMQEPDVTPVRFNGIDTTYGELRAARLSYYQALGLCEDTAKCNKYVEDLSYAAPNSEMLTDYNNVMATKRAELNSKIVEREKSIRAYKAADNVGNMVFVGLQYLNARHMIDWFFTDYWTEKWFGAGVSDFLNPDKWKESLCNPVNRVHIGGTSSESTVISCEGGFCQPVLTYAVERTDLEYPNGTKYYIYTSVYYISGGDLRGRNVTYNIYFTGSDATIYGFKDDVELIEFDVVQKKKVFKAKIVFDTICIKFSEAFPVGNSLSNAKEYCRPITAKAFDNGSPWVSEEEQEEAETYLDEYDENGMRVRDPNSNSTDDRPPGIFED